MRSAGAPTGAKAAAEATKAEKAMILAAMMSLLRGVGRTDMKTHAPLTRKLVILFSWAKNSVLGWPLNGKAYFDDLAHGVANTQPIGS